MGLNVAMLAESKNRADRKFHKFFNSYKGRQVEVGQRVDVYRNLSFRNRVVYSVRDHYTGLVLGHSENLLLTGCNFVVNQAGRKRVLRQKRKNVHAWVEGNYGVVHAGDYEVFSHGVIVRYNPYENETFVRMYEEGETKPVLGANLVWIDQYGVYASGL